MNEDKLINMIMIMVLTGLLPFLASIVLIGLAGVLIG